MKEYAEFCGVRLLSWAVMSNHFHILVEVPTVDRENMPAEEVLRRMTWIYKLEEVDQVRGWLKQCRSEAAKREILNRYTYRMGDLRQFMKSLKQRFTQWFNTQHGRAGTLWECRYRSVVVEGALDAGSGVVWGEDGGKGGKIREGGGDVGDADGGDGVGGGLSYAARVVAAYIDLNPVRAGLVEDPAEYPWSSYGAAVGGGDRDARAGMARLWGKGVKEALRAHRMLVFREGSEDVVPESGEKSKRVGISREKVAEVIQDGGKVPVALALRVRVQWMTRGAVLGSEAFVRRIYEKSSGRLGRSGAHPGGVPVAGADWGGVHAFRE